MLQQKIPNFLKILKLKNCDLNDKFCKNFSKIFFKFHYLQEVDLSDNRNITSIGKIYLFYALFDKLFDNTNLKSF
jgi:hypothetical protein